MRIREAVPEDSEAIRGVHYESIMSLGRTSYSQEQVEAWAAGCATADYRSTVESTGNHCVVAEEERGIVGFGTLVPSQPVGSDPAVDAEVTAVYVHPAVTREGIGTALYEGLERTARERDLRSLGLTASRNAVPFYEDRGYERILEKEHEFSSHESTDVSGTVVEMRKDLHD